MLNDDPPDIAKNSEKTGDPQHPRSPIWGLGVEGLGFRVQGFGFRTSKGLQGALSSNPCIAKLSLNHLPLKVRKPKETGNSVNQVIF